MLIRFLIKFVLTAIVVYLIATYIPGIHAADGKTILLVALVWSLLTMFVRPVLKILTFPINLITLGLFSFVLNALLFFSITYFVHGFTVSGVIPAFIGSIILSLITSLLAHNVKPSEDGGF